MRNQQDLSDIDVFISYCKEDSAQASQLKQLLKDASFKVFIDDEAIRAGDKINKSINNAISSTKSLVVIITRNLIYRGESCVVCDEIREAQRLNHLGKSIKIIPFFPSGFTSIEHLINDKATNEIKDICQIHAADNYVELFYSLNSHIVTDAQRIELEKKMGSQFKLLVAYPIYDIADAEIEKLKNDIKTGLDSNRRNNILITEIGLLPDTKSSTENNESSYLLRKLNESDGLYIVYGKCDAELFSKSYSEITRWSLTPDNLTKPIIRHAKNDDTVPEDFYFPLRDIIEDKLDLTKSEGLVKLFIRGSLRGNAYKHFSQEERKRDEHLMSKVFNDSLNDFKRINKRTKGSLWSLLALTFITTAILGYNIYNSQKTISSLQNTTFTTQNTKIREYMNRIASHKDRLDIDLKVVCFLPESLPEGNKMYLAYCGNRYPSHRIFGENSLIDAAFSNNKSGGKKVVFILDKSDLKNATRDSSDFVKVTPYKATPFEDDYIITKSDTIHYKLTPNEDKSKEAYIIAYANGEIGVTIDIIYPKANTSNDEKKALKSKIFKDSTSLTENAARLLDEVFSLEHKTDDLDLVIWNQIRDNPRQQNNPKN